MVLNQFVEFPEECCKKLSKKAHWETSEGAHVQTVFGGETSDSACSMPNLRTWATLEKLECSRNLQRRYDLSSMASRKRLPIKLSLNVMPLNITGVS